MLLRFVDGRPLSAVTIDFLKWSCQSLARRRVKVLALIWDNASWHISQMVRTWIRALARLGADPARGGYARFNARAVGGVPLPDGVVEDAELAGASRTRQQDQPSTVDIDELAAIHLQLSPAARKILARVAGEWASSHE